MLNIAICDDQPKELELIYKDLIEYLEAHPLVAETKNSPIPINY